MRKEQLLHVAEMLEDEFELDELFERLAVIQGIEQGLKSLKEGQGIPQSQVEEQMKEYMQKRRDERDNLVP
jgi:hypothetical protein